MFKITLSTFFLLLLIPFILSAQNRPELSGEFELEVDEGAQDSYSISQQKALNYFNSLVSQLDPLRQLGTAHLENLDESTLQYLSAVYLFCTINQGTCPIVLDALLEADLIQSRLRNSAQCDNLQRFWKIWLKNDMERRQEYLAKTGFLNVTDQFKRERRGRYIKCKETIETEMASSLANPEFFQARYKQDSPPFLVVSQMPVFLNKVKSSVANVFAATGITVQGQSDNKARSTSNTPNKKSGSIKKILK